MFDFDALDEALGETRGSLDAFVEQYDNGPASASRVGVAEVVNIDEWSDEASVNSVEVNPHDTTTTTSLQPHHDDSLSTAEQHISYRNRHGLPAPSRAADAHASTEPLERRAAI